MSEKSEHDQKIIRSYFENIHAKTGKTLEDFRGLASTKGLVKSGEIVAWLKAEYGLGHGHAGAVANWLANADAIKASPADKTAVLFAGGKVVWREAFDQLERQVKAFGADVEVMPNRTYFNLCRGVKKFGLVQISSIERVDVGIKLKGHGPTVRLELAGSWNVMVTHRVRVNATAQIDAELLGWLRQAYSMV